VTALPALVEALEDPAPELAQWAALALGRMGPAAASAVEALERASESANRVVANAASQALRQVQQ
jgi:HEAT repeat protein